MAWHPQPFVQPRVKLVLNLAVGLLLVSRVAAETPKLNILTNTDGHAHDAQGLSKACSRLSGMSIIMFPGVMGSSAAVISTSPFACLRWHAMEKLVGPKRALREMECKQQDHYQAIHVLLLANGDQVDRW
jgi:hypothetical protein